jgi:hypothetical protein
MKCKRWEDTAEEIFDKSWGRADRDFSQLTLEHEALPPDENNLGERKHMLENVFFLFNHISVNCTVQPLSPASVDIQKDCF